MLAESHTMNIPGHFINLSRASGRRRHMESEAVRLDLPIERLAAVDGTKMTRTDYQRWHPKAGSMHRLSKLEVACFLSHRAAWTQIVNDNKSFGAVFEDDLTFADDAPAFLGSDSWIPDGADIVKIETTSRKVMLSPPFLNTHNGRNTARMTSQHLGAGGYIISRDYAARLLARTDPVTLPVDYTLFSPNSAISDDPEIWQLYPAICVQQVRTRKTFLPSDAEHSGLDSARATLKLHGMAKLRRELIRPFSNVATEMQQQSKALYTGKQWKLIKFRQ